MVSHKKQISILPNHDNLSLVNTPRVKDLGFPAAASEVLANQPAQGENEPALDSTEKVWDEVGRRTEVSLGQFCVADPNFVKKYQYCGLFSANL